MDDPQSGRWLAQAFSSRFHRANDANLSLAVSLLDDGQEDFTSCGRLVVDAMGHMIGGITP
jgi:hypothetical protein